MSNKEISRILIVAVFVAFLFVIKEVFNEPEPMKSKIELLSTTQVAQQEEENSQEEPENTSSAPVIKMSNETFQARIDRFLALLDKALLSDEERIERDRLFSNKQVLASAEKTLVSVEPRLFTREGLKQRFAILSFMEKALEWKGNPIREEILDSVERVIESASFRESQKEDIRRSLVGDKMELFAELKGNDPERAQRLYDRYQGTKLQKILDYAAKRFVF